MGLDLTGQIIDNIVLSKVDAPIGTYRDSDLEPELFNEENLGTWMLCNGDDCSNTEYGQKTQKTNVPDFVTDGTFRRQAKAGRELGSFEADDNKNHQHVGGFARANGYAYADQALYGEYIGAGGKAAPSQAGGGYQGSYAYTSPTGGEARPKNIACNVYIKVGHS